MSYPGGKNGSGVYQAIINQIPPHSKYIELFLGGGSIMLNKLPAAFNIGVDIDNSVLVNFIQLPAFEKLRDELTGDGHRYRYDFEFRTMDALQYLQLIADDKSVFIYVDPPYLGSTRNNRKYYKHEFMSQEQHQDLLSRLSSFQHCHIMISGYHSLLYDEFFHTRGWRCLEFSAMSRNGKRTECLWMNYSEPERLHDCSYVGKDFTDRQRIRRKAQRWVDGLQRLPLHERQAVLSQIEQTYF